MTTREEFDWLVDDLVRSVDYTQFANGCRQERAALLAAYDAQAARIAELEAALKEKDEYMRYLEHNADSDTLNGW